MQKETNAIRLTASQRDIAFLAIHHGNNSKKEMALSLTGL